MGEELIAPPPSPGSRCFSSTRRVSVASNTIHGGLMIRKLLICFTAFFFISPALAQVETWKIDPNHSAAQFAVRHMGISTVRGEFRKVTGSANYDPSDPGKTSLEATMDATTVDTRVEMRDKDLRSPNFLDVDKYPTITFKSKRAESAGT